MHAHAYISLYPYYYRHMNQTIYLFNPYMIGLSMTRLLNDRYLQLLRGVEVSASEKPERPDLLLEQRVADIPQSVPSNISRLYFRHVNHTVDDLMTLMIDTYICCEMNICTIFPHINVYLFIPDIFILLMI